MTKSALEAETTILDHFENYTTQHVTWSRTPYVNREYTVTFTYPPPPHATSEKGGSNGLKCTDQFQQMLAAVSFVSTTLYFDAIIILFQYRLT